MTISESESYTKMLLKRHLPKDYKNWKIEFYYTSKYAGQCDFNRKAITLSLFSMERSSTRQTQEACQHEVAHAIAGHEAGHGYIWQRIHRQLGGNGERIGGDDNYTEGREGRQTLLQTKANASAEKNIRKDFDETSDSLR